MKVYADYTFYINVYGGKDIGEGDFAAAALQATQYLKYITLGRTETYEGEELEYATCAVAESYYSVFDRSGTGDMKSETTDGYSVSYVTQGQDGEDKETLFRRKAYKCAQYWLSNTGLMQRSVGVC